MNDLRTLRLPVLLSPAEITVIDNFRSTHRLPSCAAAVRELLKRGLTATISPAAIAVKSSSYSAMMRRLPLLAILLWSV
jgi:hypothetical protein